MAEQLICNQHVVGSTPITSSNEFTQRELLYGRFPEWPKGADCKSVVADFGGPNPPSPTKIETYPCGMSLFCLVMVEMRNAAAAVVRNRFRFCEPPPFTTAVHFPHLCGKFVVTNPPSPTKTPRACSGCFTDSFFPFPSSLPFSFAPLDFKQKVCYTIFKAIPQRR